MAALAPQVQLCPASALLCQATSGGGSARRCSKKSFGVVTNKSDGNSLNSNGEPASRCHQLNTRQWKPRSASRSLRSSQARPVATNYLWRQPSTKLHPEEWPGLCATAGQTKCSLSRATQSQARRSHIATCSKRPAPTCAAYVRTWGSKRGWQQ